MPLIEKRNRAVAELHYRLTRLQTIKLRSARKAVKSAVAHAKQNWVINQCNVVNEFRVATRGTKRCWDAVN